jgi:putative transposase
LVDVFVLFFLHVGSRRVFVAGVTAHPDRAWVAQQARNFLLHSGEQADPPAYLLRDYDNKFVPEFDAVLESEGVTVKQVGPRAPNLNAHAERWVRTVRQECLDHFVVFGEDHLRYLVTDFVIYYNRFRPHQGVGNRPLAGDLPQAEVGPLPDIGCEERLGGLLRHYVRRAA